MREGREGGLFVNCRQRKCDKQLAEKVGEQRDGHGRLRVLCRCPMCDVQHQSWATASTCIC